MIEGISIYEILTLTSIVFFIGIYGFLTRKNLITMLLSVELILNASAVNFVVEGAELGDAEDNLVSKAARLFAERTGKEVAYRVTLEKRVPAGAGLGGGSSDAAAMLRALDTLEETGLEPAVLEELGATLDRMCRSSCGRDRAGVAGAARFWSRPKRGPCPWSCSSRPSEWRHPMPTGAGRARGN